MKAKNNFTTQYGEWAVVTGGTSGIGEAIANNLAEKGLNIILVARRKKLLEEKSAEIQKRYKVKVNIIDEDLSTESGVNKVIESTNDLDIGLLVASAGIETHGAFIENTIESEISLVKLNILSTTILSHHFAKRMAIKGKGGILLLSSVAGHSAQPYLANYAASKAYMLILGESLHQELNEKGVDVTVLSPGLTDTPMASSAGIDWSKTPAKVMSPTHVAAIGINALGKKPSVIAGSQNKFIVLLNKYLFSRKTAARMSKNAISKAI